MCMHCLCKQIHRLGPGSEQLSHNFPCKRKNIKLLGNFLYRVVLVMMVHIFDSESANWINVFPYDIAAFTSCLCGCAVMQ